METHILKNVPADAVDQVVEEFEAEGYTVRKVRQPDGTFTVSPPVRNQPSAEMPTGRWRPPVIASATN